MMVAFLIVEHSGSFDLHISLESICRTWCDTFLTIRESLSYLSWLGGGRQISPCSLILRAKVSSNSNRGGLDITVAASSADVRDDRKKLEYQPGFPGKTEVNIWGTL